MLRTPLVPISAIFHNKTIPVLQPPPRAENVGHRASQPFTLPPHGAECWSFHPYTSPRCRTLSSHPLMLEAVPAVLVPSSEAAVELEDTWGCKMEQNFCLALL